MGYDMHGLVFVGNGSLYIEDILKLLASFAIARRNKISANVIIGKDMPFTIGNGMFKFDYILYEVEKIPIDIKVLVKNEQPIAIIEDSTDLKRLKNRQIEIENLLIQHDIIPYYMHVTTPRNKKENIVMKLVEKSPGWYVLEI
jgi:hypothetical protein